MGATGAWRVRPTQTLDFDTAVASPTLVTVNGENAQNESTAIAFLYTRFRPKTLEQVCIPSFFTGQLVIQSVDLVSLPPLYILGLH